MAKRPDLVDITSITNSSTINAINQNWDRIQEAFDNTVSLDGSVPNAMNGDLDINGNAILNVGTIDADNLTLNGQTVVDLASVPEWRSAWVTATSYAKNDLVKTNGNVYICLIAHTSGTFATDLTAVKWELMVSKGDSGGGTGDLLAANNLSDVANPATARANLGLGTVATQGTVPLSMGGTGATDAAGALSALGGQPLGATLTSLEGLSLVAGDLLYATAADTLVRLPAGSTGQVLTVTGGVPVWAATSFAPTESSVITLTGGAVNLFTGLPAGVKRINVWIRSASLSAGSIYAGLQLSTSSSFVITGYTSGSGNRGGEIQNTARMVDFGSYATAAGVWSVKHELRLVNASTNTWHSTHTGSRASDGASFGGDGYVSLAGVIDGIRYGSSSTFDGGVMFGEWYTY